MAKRTDANQAEIVAALRAAGASVVDLHRVGHGCPDLAVSFRQHTWLMEVKMPDGVLKYDQQQFINRWCDKVWVVRSIEDALWAIGAIE